MKRSISVKHTTHGTPLMTMQHLMTQSMNATESTTSAVCEHASSFVCMKEICDKPIEWCHMFIQLNVWHHSIMYFFEWLGYGMDNTMNYMVYRATGELIATCNYRTDAKLIAKQWNDAYVTDTKGNRL